MTEPTVSVALATYDGERYLEQQLRSILEQERRPDEIVVSDGGSTDGTVDLARRVLTAHPGVEARVIADGARLGVAANFARAIGAASGDLIALSDQDDIWHPDRLDRQVAAFDDPEVLLAHGEARLVDADGAPFGEGLFEALGLGADELAALGGPDAFALLIRRNLVTGATVMLRRALLQVAVPFPASWVHDEWLAALAAAFGRIAPDPDPLIDYRQHGANAIGVEAPTLRYRIGRMLEPRDGRYERLAERAAALAVRLDELDPPARWRELAERKAAFEAVRAGYPAPRLRRLASVRAAARGADYAELSSQGRLDILRDLVQPA
jgi:glycosyltransferase involved in cell wall biosynthesis